ncbi:MAG: 30S ribosome-binding factor RbfA [Thermogutta sp.]
MSSRRALKLAEAVRHVVSSAILFELKDPRVRDVTVTYVEVSEDLRFAKVHVSVMGDEKRQRLTLRGLQSAAGFLQAKCAEKIETRWTPKLTFVLDQGVKHSIEISRILAEVLPRPVAADEGKPSGEEETETAPDSNAESVVPDSSADKREIAEASSEPESHPQSA